MNCTHHFRQTKTGNYFARFGEIPCTVFTGKYGGWCYFIDGARGSKWFDTASEAMAAAVAVIEQPRIPACLQFFGLAPPVDRAALMARYREAAKATHPDHGGSNELFKQVQAAFESALLLVRGAA